MKAELKRSNIMENTRKKFILIVVITKDIITNNKWEESENIP